MRLRLLLLDHPQTRVHLHGSISGRNISDSFVNCLGKYFWLTCGIPPLFLGLFAIRCVSNLHRRNHHDNFDFCTGATSCRINCSYIGRHFCLKSVDDGSGDTLFTFSINSSRNYLDRVSKLFSRIPNFR